MDYKDKILKQMVFYILMTGFTLIFSSVIYSILNVVNRFSPAYNILTSVTLAASGIFILVFGFNILYLYKTRSLIITALASLLCIIAIIGFVTLYPVNWFYPNVGYIAIAYVTGIFMLTFNSISNQLKNELFQGNKALETFPFDNHISAAFGGMLVSQIINPVDEFKVWDSTMEENKTSINMPFFLSTTENKNNYLLHVEDETSVNEQNIVVPKDTEKLNINIINDVNTIENEGSVSDLIPQNEILYDYMINIIEMENTDIKIDDDMQEAAHKILKFHFGKMIKHEPGTMLGKDIEELHDMRVAAMRMKAVMQIFHGHLDIKLKRYFQNIKITRKYLGGVRDLDVFMERIDTYLENLPPERKSELDNLISTLTIERDKARGLMLFHLDSEKHNKFKFKFVKTLEKKHKWTEFNVDKNGIPHPHKVIDVLPSLLYNQLAKIRSYNDLVYAEDRSFEMLHALRIDIKLIRYTLEFFEEVLGSKTSGVIKDLKKLQDNLGDLHDAVVAVNLLKNYKRYGKWESHSDKNLIEQNKHDDQGLDNYLNSRDEQISKLLNEFPIYWEIIMGADFGTRFAAVVGSLYEA